MDTSKIKQLMSLKHGIGSITEINIPENSKIHNTKLIELKLTENLNIISIERDGKLIVPRGSTQIKSKDTLLVLSNNIPVNKLESIFKIN